LNCIPNGHDLQNIQYARSLLTKLELDALGIKVLSRRQEWQADLNRKRDFLDQVTERIKDLEEIGPEDDDESSDGEDILSTIIPTPSESMDSRSTGMPLEEPEEPPAVSAERGSSGTMPGNLEAIAQPSPPYNEKQEESRAAPEATPTPISEKQETTTTSQTLRSRRQAESNEGRHREDEKDAAQTTGSAALFGDRAVSQTATTEAILDTQRAEQDSLSESILRLATDLKESSRAFAGLLEEDHDVVNAAGKGLDRNEAGLDVAARRMGALRKITEGEGWWGRLMLYAWIYGLMVALVLLVFVLPKLRF
jgi:hypothetical protein